MPAGDSQSNEAWILRSLRHATSALDDDELARRTGISPRQTVNQICRRLTAEGVLVRHSGPDGKIVNELTQPSVDDSREMSVPAGVSAEIGESDSTAAGSSAEQRAAERYLLDALGSRLGVSLVPRTVTRGDGVRVELDGADVDCTVLVECWAHQGPAKVAQKYKLVNDAVKLHWVGSGMAVEPRKILCVSDEAAVRHLRGRSWQGRAIADLGVSIEVVSLPDDVRAAVVRAQVRQFS